MSVISARTIRQWYKDGFEVLDLESETIKTVYPTDPAPYGAADKTYEGSVIELPLGRLCMPHPTEKGRFGIDKTTGEKLRYIPEVFDLDFANPLTEEWHIPCGTTYLFEIDCRINVPMDCCARLYQNASLLKPFVWVSVVDGQPNYQGLIQGLIHVAMPGGFDIMKGYPLLAMRYHTFDTPYTDIYKGSVGNHVGNVISTEGKTMIGGTRVYVNREDQSNG